jgi:hypothetical protein
LATFRALHSALFGLHQRWNKLRRTGDVTASAPGGITTVVTPSPAPAITGEPRLA